MSKEVTNTENQVELAMLGVDCFNFREEVFKGAQR